MTEPKESPETEPVIVAAYCDACGYHAGPDESDTPCEASILLNIQTGESRVCPGTLAPAVSLAAWREMKRNYDDILDAYIDQTTKLNAALARLGEEGKRNG